MKRLHSGWRIALAIVVVFGLARAGLLLHFAQAQAVDQTPPSPSSPHDGFPKQLTQQDIEKMLPPTDMRLPYAGHAHKMNLDASATSFDNASLPDNPLAPQARPVGSKTCISCHALENLHFSHTAHARAFRADAMGSGADRTCESCHGPGSEHAQDPAKPGLVIAFTKGSDTPVATQTATCLACHAGGARQHWIGSVHQSLGMSCSDCHNPMAQQSPEGLLAKSTINEVCATCHADIRAKFNDRSHMPLPEGQISCADCHNPHGTITSPLLKTDTVNETCYACHAEKRGPFLFEHAPVRENCLNCHDPHGSNNQTLLILPVPMLCQQCHTNTLHPNDLQVPTNLGLGPTPDERLMGRACLSCHTNIHGSNNPSGSHFHK